MNLEKSKKISKGTGNAGIFFILLLVGMYGIYYYLKPQETLPSQTKLTSYAKESGLSKKLEELSVTNLKLTCNRNKKITGTFEFFYLEGREPLQSETNNSCSTTGEILNWYPEVIYARENYNVELINNQINSLIEQNKLTINKYNKDWPELSITLDKEFSSLISEKNFKEVLFTCSKAGENFTYVSRPFEKYKSREKGTINTKCVKASQNFEISYNPNYNSRLMIHTYNQISADLIRSVYKDFLEGSPEKSSF